jgi:vacuolar-type H+-ATPase subunit C/Vma6
MKLASNRFAFLVSVLKAREAKGVESEMLEEILLRAASMPEAVEFMKGTDLGDYLAELGAMKFADIDEQLWKYLNDYFNRIRKLRPHPSVVRLIEHYLHKYDVANIISALRAAASQRPPHMIPVGTLRDQGLLDELSRVQTFSDIAAILVTGGMADYAQPIRMITDNDRRAVRHAERLLDRLYLQRLGNVLKGMDDSGVLLAAHGILLDHLCLGRIIRMVAAGRPGTTEGGSIASGGYLLPTAVCRELAALKIPEIASRLEDTSYRAMVEDIGREIEHQGAYTIDLVMESERIRRARELLSPRSLSPCAVLWHLLFKEVELRNVRLAMKAVEDRLPPAEVKDYLAVGL